MATTYAPSPKAVAFAKGLTTQTWTGTPEVLESLLKTYDTMDAKAISKIIDLLKPIAAAQKFTAAKAAQPVTVLPAGRYALRDEDLGIELIYQIDKPETGKWAGWTFVKQLDGDEKTAIRGEEKVEVLAALEAFGHLEAAKLYGKITGRCSICGTQLTNPQSIEAGIGPICAKKF